MTTPESNVPSCRRPLVVVARESARTRTASASRDFCKRRRQDARGLLLADICPSDRSSVGSLSQCGDEEETAGSADAD
jgi:hypothetical protein